MQLGTIKTLRFERGYAFISVDGGGEAFCPASTIKRSGLVDLKEGDKIRFDSRPDNKGGALPFVFVIERA